MNPVQYCADQLCSNSGPVPSVSMCAARDSHAASRSRWAPEDSRLTFRAGEHSSIQRETLALRTASLLPGAAILSRMAGQGIPLVGRNFAIVGNGAGCIASLTRNMKMHVLIFVSVDSTRGLRRAWLVLL